MRTLSTAMESVRPVDLAVEFSNHEHEFDVYGFGQDQNLLVGLWLPDAAFDRHPGVTTGVVIETQAYHGS